MLYDNIYVIEGNITTKIAIHVCSIVLLCLYIFDKLKAKTQFVIFFKFSLKYLK